MSDSVTVETWIDAKPDQVFVYLTDPEKMAQWMGVEHRVDPRPGGNYWVNMTGKHISAGAYRQVEADKVVSFTFGWEGGEVVPPGSSLVTITLESERGGTRVRLEHTGLPSAEAAASHKDGWQHYLDRLTVAAAGGDPGPDQWMTE